MDIDNSLINELKQKVDKAESHINHLRTMESNFPDGLDIPSVNELRYALNHLLRYLTGEQSGAKDAIKHVHRAIYDCYETEIHYQFNNFVTFQEDTKDIPVLPIFPDYIEWVEKFSVLQTFMNNVTQHQREDYYSQLGDLLDTIRPFVNKSVTVRQEVFLRAVVMAFCASKLRKATHVE